MPNTSTEAQSAYTAAQSFLQNDALTRDLNLTEFKLVSAENLMEKGSESNNVGRLFNISIIATDNFNHSAMYDAILDFSTSRANSAQPANEIFKGLVVLQNYDTARSYPVSVSVLDYYGPRTGWMPVYRNPGFDPFTSNPSVVRGAEDSKVAIATLLGVPDNTLTVKTKEAAQISQEGPYLILKLLLNVTMQDGTTGNFTSIVDSTENTVKAIGQTTKLYGPNENVVQIPLNNTSNVVSPVVPDKETANGPPPPAENNNIGNNTTTVNETVPLKSLGYTTSYRLNFIYILLMYWVI